jgi:predicted RNA methylase
MRCFEDKTRTLIFFDTIREKIKTGDHVLEAGAGTGIMAVAAAQAGAIRVDTVEINPLTAIFARKVIQRCVEAGLLQPNQVKIKLGDALKFQLKEGQKPFDAFISENIYTGQFNELQQQITNHMLESGVIDVKQNKIIPKNIINGFELTSLPDDLSDEVKQKLKNRSDFVARDIYDPNKPKSISLSKLYDLIHLDTTQELGFRNRLVETITKDGTIDTITIFSLIQMTEKEGNFLRRNETEFLNNDHVIVLEKSMEVKEGDKVEIYISYKGGDKPGQADIILKNLNSGEIVVNLKNKDE